jgi:hypothetical protein
MAVPPDLSMRVGDMAHPPDMTQLGQFGDPCTAYWQCESQYCVFSGISGICTQLCPPDCPTGYGCYSVLGSGIDPGSVTDICVPNDNEICTPCTLSSECSSAGKDLCLPGPLGGNFCARDCSTIACPTGYTCNTLNIGGIDVKQCQPTVGSCDCHTPAQVGASMACPITTPFGTCNGQIACQPTGWSSCAPPSTTDTPDATYTDDNCDGIDGDINGGIFVATTGNDADPTCGLAYTNPCQTVNNGLARAVIESKKYVYVQAGIYNEVVTLQAGKVVVGGYDAMWQRNARTVGGHEVRIVGQLDSATGQYMAVKGQNVTIAVTFMDLNIQGPDAGGVGKSSYAVYLDNSKVTLQRGTVIAGAGSGGSSGSNASGVGTVAATGAGGMGGSKGGDSNNSCESCNTSTRGSSGGAGTNSCSGSINPNGGSGGLGGTKDTSCSCFLGACVCSNCNATNGFGGNDAAQTYSSVYGVAGGQAGTCTNANAGASGLVQNGSGGSASSARGFLSGSFWAAWSGGGGQLGEHGSGGGGGSGSGGCDNGCDSDGAGGGGGGAGGCRSPDAGGGGSGGGGSFGVFAVNSAVVNATDCEVDRGNGGQGGPGGNGGRGQDGGLGNSGGNGAGGSQAGGQGGDGAHGGHGGAGAGGSGGISTGFFSYNSTITESCSIMGGQFGYGGNPGPRPAGSDGNDGATGTNGTLSTTFTCAAPGGC